MTWKKWFGIISGVVLVGLIGTISYFYMTDPARLTTAPDFTNLTRTVTNNVLLSPSEPDVMLTFDERYTYIGGQTFTLYGTAAVEQHFFVEAYPDGRMKSFFWLQFERFLPDNTFTYDYSESPLQIQIGDYDFFTDTAAGIVSPIFQLGQPGTDGYLARKFAADRGYHYPDEYLYARLVHIPDVERRTELLIIFIDDLAPTGFSATALREGGEDAEEWPTVEATMLDKIRSVMQIEPLPS
ncbi:MAG: hypothetical protein AAF846_22700 [Chloroflexota bacterium]